MKLKYLFVITAFFITNSLFAASKYTYTPHSSCTLFENIGGKWTKVDPSTLGSNPVFVTSGNQPNYYYVKKDGVWFMSQKDCFSIASNTSTKSSRSTENKKSSSSTQKTLLHLSILSWKDEISILSSASNTPYLINTSQLGAKLGLSFNLSSSSSMDILGEAGFIFAFGTTTSANTAITYNTSGNYILGALLGIDVEMKPSSKSGFYWGLEPFMIYRTGDWVAPTSTTRTYSIDGKSAMKFGGLLGAKKYLSNSMYFKPQLGAVLNSSISLMWSIQLGVAL